ncbi:Kunitz/Bovine pancreatic trypsin inhibitor domain protein [Necator americanus]|uniref:Kunitz/Bovine pancreatic trypsin inhibitor domain protein n=1 Tax=Necator americanus TaxID=51031 RepID=W2TG78_NECAM|nr:Kunitz/Bovine pancreatic trypsin inhibitor domain protein [Necator americanus]ETN80022.1 Kunitz/Bovine pancreatic trypsin inhibitor domain protein [Necator americanus]
MCNARKWKSEGTAKSFWPILCTTTSTETQKSNGGDGSTWCVYPDGDRDIFIADIYDCIAHPQVTELQPIPAFVCAQPMESGDDPHVPRWWFNAATGTCTQFMWDPNNVEGVSPNNFRTVEHCESYCRDSGLLREPKMQGGIIGAAFHHCLSAGCNRGAIEFVHSTSAVYEETPRSGCLSSRSTCSQNNECVLIGSLQICCPTREYICSASGGRAYSTKQVTNFDQGVSIAGSGPTTRYYYDVDKGRCVSFVYYGLGNFNNFNTKQECEAFCSKPRVFYFYFHELEGCPNGAEPLKEGRSSRQVDCTTLDSCPPTHECVEVPVNGNVVHRCCPTKVYMCSQAPQPGSQCSTVSTTRYYFNLVTRQCESFQYNGCSGNHNNFANKEQCINFCASSGCDPGEIVLKEPGTLHPLYCTNNTRNSCPGTSQCRFNALVASSVCCGFKTAMKFLSDECPKDEQPYMNPLDESVRECAMNVPGTCPAHFLCRFNGKKNRYYCCAPSAESGLFSREFVPNLEGEGKQPWEEGKCDRTPKAGSPNGVSSHAVGFFHRKDLCPEGRALYRSKKTSLPLRCFINSPNVCSNGFSCQSRTKGVTQGFCCSKKTIVPWDTAVKCLSFSQAPDFVAKLAASKGQVRRDLHLPRRKINSLIIEGCPPGEHVLTKIGEIVACDPFNGSDGRCPPTYSCQYAILLERYQCCGGQSSVEEETMREEGYGCPPSQVAFLLNNEIVLCTSSENKCPLGYFCQFSAKNKQYQCCGQRSGCPGSSMAFLDLPGEAKRCLQGMKMCPTGYSCQMTKRGDFLCCSDMAVKDSFRINVTVTSDVSTLTKALPKQTSTVSAGPLQDRETQNYSRIVCEPNAHPINTECRLVNNTSIGTETIRGRCSENTQCNSETICRSRCRCVAGTIYYKNRCLANLCGAQWEPVTDTDHGVIECIGGVMCPRGSSCKFSTTISSYLCCRPNRTAAVNQSGLLTQPRLVSKHTKHKNTLYNEKLKTFHDHARVVGTRNEVTSKVSKWTEANVVPFAAATPDLRYYSPLSDWIFLCGPHVLSLCGARTVSSAVT